MKNPKDDRMIETRDGWASVPRSVRGVPLTEYLRNVELPDNLERAVVYPTPGGPVALEPDPVPWTEHHDERVQHYAETLREQIEEKGYYANSLKSFARRLSTETGYPQSEMKALIVSSFDAANGMDPFSYLQQQRAEKGLPVRERNPEMSQAQEPEL
ncbi:MAG: hypothetical protein KDA50_06465 [Rhodobacteraceae bacterium]|nr:hypothetical protein [Paracoccaceae bacterium]